MAKLALIKDCPFCGGKAKLIKGSHHKITHAYVQCIKCAASGPIIRKLTIPAPASERDYTEVVNKAVEGWNRRA